MTLVVVHLRWVDSEFGRSTACPVLLGQLGVCQNWLGSWAREWNIQIKVNPTMVRDHQSPRRVHKAKAYTRDKSQLSGQLTFSYFCLLLQCG